MIERHKEAAMVASQGSSKDEKIPPESASAPENGKAASVRGPKAFSEILHLEVSTSTVNTYGATAFPPTGL